MIKIRRTYSVQYDTYLLILHYLHTVALLYSICILQGTPTRRIRVHLYDSTVLTD
jgi:hypothetical protein